MSFLSSIRKPTTGECLDWIEDPSYDPVLKKTINSSGTNRMKFACSELVKSLTYSPDECKEWLENRSVNPRTGRAIKENGTVYRLYEKHCSVYQSIGPYGDAAHTFEELDNAGSDCKGFTVASYLQKAFFPCLGSNCTIPGCKIPAFSGIHIGALPTLLRSVLGDYINIIKNKDCCCFCFWHLFALIYPMAVRMSTPPGVNELIKIQNVVDVFDSYPEGKAMEKLIKIEGSRSQVKLLNGMIGISKPDPYIQAFLKELDRLST